MELLGVYGLDFVLLITFAVLFYRAADIEGAPKLLWTGLSIAVSLGVRIISWGIVGLVSCQVVLFFAIAITRAIISSISKK